MPRIFFATDLHGSETCWRKFLNAARYYEAEVLICGGDMTGKAIIPLVEENGTFEFSLSGERELVSLDRVEEAENLVRRKGYYPVRVTPDQLHQLDVDEGSRRRLFQQVMLEGVQRWMDLAHDKLQGTGVRCFVCPGNDDEMEVDRVIASSDAVELGEGRVIEVAGFEMISTGWSNPTPWNTHREEDEDALRRRIDAMASQVHDVSRAIFNLHPPPYGSGLDEAPALDKEMRPKHGGRALTAVGSKAVRGAIEHYGPLLSLHGHVHEGKGVAKLGRTLAINPGSAYEEGLLMGAVVMLDDKRGVKSYQLVSG